MLGGNAEAAVGMRAAQVVEIMRREVDDEQAAAGLEDAGGLGEGADRFLEEVQHLMDGDEVGEAVGEGERIDFAMAHLGIAHVGGIKIDARNGQHVAARVDADRLLCEGRKAAEYRTRAGAEIDVEADGGRTRQLHHGLFDILLAHVQRTELFPARRVLGEIARGRLGAAAADLLEPSEVAGQHGVGAGQQVDDGAGESAPHVFLAQAEQDPVPLLVAADEARFGHELQVAADTRLALAQDLGQLADIGLAMGKDEQDAHTGRFRRGAQAGEQFFHSKPP